MSKSKKKIKVWGKKLEIKEKYFYISIEKRTFFHRIRATFLIFSIVLQHILIF